jgi:cysteine desulfurase / selenocysteine lyase
MISEYNIAASRAQFPILERKIHGKPLIYLDNGATTQKPISVINRINKYYADENANIHRGVHFLSDYSTNEYEQARRFVQSFINAAHEEEVIFTKGTTDSINTIANSFATTFFKEGDEVIISYLEHHSNIVPWQMVCDRVGAKLKVIPIDENGELVLSEYELLLSEKTKFVAVNHVSNALGTINDIDAIIEKAHRVGAKVLIDGAQSIQHMKVDVQAMNADFFVFSAHKLYGPTGVGILYGKQELLNEMVPYQGGGDMIKTVSFEKTVYNDLPHKFEAGTPNIVGGIALGESIKFIESVGLDAITKHEQDLLEYADQSLSVIKGLKILGPDASRRSSVISMVIDGVHPFDVGTLLDSKGIAVRTGHHCAQPIMDFYEIPGTLRASIAMYNTKEEIDILVEAINKAVSILR